MVELLDIFLPILCFIIFSLLTLPVLRVIRKRKGKTTLLLALWFITIFITVALTVLNLAIKYYNQSSAEPFQNLSLIEGPLAIFSSSFLIDAISIYMSIIFIVISAVVFLYSLLYIDPSERPSDRYYATILMILGCLFGATFSGDLLTLFIFWEASAAGSSFLMLYKKSAESINATLKYLIMIIIASALIVFGLSIIFNITGTLNFWAVKQALIAMGDKRLFTMAFIFIASGYAIESAVVPFHMWLPDAYTAAPASSSVFLSSLIDQGSYYVLLRVLVYILTPPDVLDWRVTLGVLASLTMVLGNFLALGENKVKRLIAYVCIADVGYNLVAITSVTPLGTMGNLFFFFTGGITTALAFMIMGVINDKGIHTLEDLKGLGRKMPYSSFALLIAFFSFAGIPPCAGLIAKYLVFTSAIEGNLGWLAVIGVLASVLQAAYLLRVIINMYTKPPEDTPRIKEPTKLLVPIFILTIFIIVLGVYPTIILNLITPVADQLPLIP